MRDYEEAISRRKAQHGDKFSESGLAQQFRRYYNSQERVKVHFEYGEELTGTIGMTTGWVPCFLLMRTSRSMGSPWTLGDKDRVIAVKSGRTYRPTWEEMQRLA